MVLNELTEKIIKENYRITKNEALALYSEDFDELGKSADRIRDAFCKNQGSICSIINAKRGGCSENCRYCAQSSWWKTDCPKDELITYEKAETICSRMVQSGVTRTSFVTAGRGLKGNDFNKMTEIIARVSKKTEGNLRLCASFGIIDESSMEVLKASGVVRYHHNLETSRNFYPNICSTHTYDERVATIKAARNAGLSSCSGGIIGMGETREDRIDMALELRDLGVESVPVNVLSPIKGTPFADLQPLGTEEILRTIAVFRFILTDRIIRMAAGRRQLDSNGLKAFQFGANGMITGDFLTLEGSDVSGDFNLFENLGFQSNQ